MEKLYLAQTIHDMKEIERKFLVNGQIQEILQNASPKAIRQGYISDEKQATVRVRTKADKGFLTIKGPTVGIEREEFEYEIPFDDALNLLNNFCPTSIHKDRYCINYGMHQWEIDVFHGKLEGLILAEIELQSADEAVEMPRWIDREVSDDTRYYNSNLIRLDSCEGIVDRGL